MSLREDERLKLINKCNKTVSLCGGEILLIPGRVISINEVAAEPSALNEMLNAGFVRIDSSGDGAEHQTAE